MLALLFLGLCLAVGWVCLPQVMAWERLLWAWPLGMIVVAASTFMLALFGGSHTTAIAIAVIGFSALVIFCVRRDRPRWQAWPDALAVLLTSIPWWGFTAWVGPRLLFNTDDGSLVAGWRIVWADWAVHARSSTFFTAQTEFSLANPLFAGTEYRYPFVSSYLSSLLQRLGASVAESLVWPTLILLALLPPLIFITGRRLGISRRAAALAVYLFLGAGGGGIAEFAQDLWQGRWFWQASAYAPRLYTDLEPWTGWPNSRVWFMNFVMAEFLPQRAFLAGLPLALLVLYLWWPATRRRRDLWLAGSCLGLLPLVHTHSYIALGLITAIVSAWELVHAAPIWKPFQAWLNSDKLTSFSFRREPSEGGERESLRWHLINQACLFVPAVVLGFGLLFGLVFSASDAGSFVRLIPGWLPDHSQATTVLSFSVFWGRNLGVMLVLAIAAGRYAPLRSLWLAAWVIFVLCNLISFQPWHWDNMKLLTYTYLLWCWPVACLLTQVQTMKRVLLAVVLIGLSLGAGWLDIASVAIASRQPITLVGAPGVAFAEAVAAATPADAVILTAPTHDHPISVLSGRGLFMGYSGWLWAYGLDPWSRESLIQTIYSEGLANVPPEIDYIAVGPAEQRFTIAPEIEALPVIVDQPPYRLLAIPESLRP